MPLLPHVMPPPAPSAVLRFPHWKTALAASRLPAAERQGHQRAILRFLVYCKVEHAPASVETIRRFLALGQADTAPALRWFYRAARGAPQSAHVMAKPGLGVRSPLDRRV